ncbi:MAG TPA: NAD-dependent epimerase/dehydratase family protein [Terrimicrobiaceae bacterium]
MKIAIIGSQGFVGAHCYSYFEQNNEVWGADISNKLAQQNFFPVEREHTDFGIIFHEHEFDLCINASGNGLVSKSLESPLFDYELNVFNTIKILECIRTKQPSCRFINLSSAAVYGNPETLPVQESSPLNPISPYGWHKRYGEEICTEYWKLHGIRSLTLRIFSLYGENLRKQLFWDIYQKTCESKRIILFGTGDETRDFLYIRDLMQVFSRVILASSFEAEALNVAAGVEISIRTAAELFCQALDPTIEITFNGNTKKGDPSNWRADISKLQRMGFAPEYTFEQGIKHVAQWILREKR